jgi:hypothetical protein
MTTNVVRWCRQHGVKIVGALAASAIAAASLSACNGSCADDTSQRVGSTAPAETTPTAVAMPAHTNDATAANNETTSGAATGHRPTVASATADNAAAGTSTAAGAVATAGAANTNPTDTANDVAALNGAGKPIATPASSAVEGLERGHTRTLVGWSDKGLVVTYAGWFCDGTMALNEGKTDAKTANVTVSGASDGSGVGCDKPTAVSATFSDVPRTAHVLKLDPGHGKQIETVKFTSGDMVQGGSFTTEEMAKGINAKHAATH